MKNLNASDLYQKYLDGNCTPEEKLLVETSYGKLVCKDPATFDEETLSESEANSWKIVAQQTHRGGKGSKRWLYAAAIAFLCVSIAGGYFMHLNTLRPKLDYNAKVINDLPPGGNKAVLILGNGKRVELEDLTDNNVGMDGGSKIIRPQAGHLVYQTENNTLKRSINTLNTPNGGTYHLTLSDGTEVWLNAASSLIFPTAFTGNERIVTFSGEAYFEVAKDARRPFIVMTNNQTITVLGTHFNVNAYTDANTERTTLLEGIVRINTPLGTKTLSPGQQAILHQNKITLSPADENAIAWKNGMIKFRNAALSDIMQQLGRWYDFKTVYPDGIPDKTFSGGMPRDRNLSELLHILELMEVHFKIEDHAGKKQITVFKN